ncbi:hypothetical protein JXR01_01710 [Candidatus Kaiserbacteria bacterium]|nr:MAG: hypothetical protein JXR01_01710 [Candidatus Kaiserbacteria bacterium]
MNNTLPQDSEASDLLTQIESILSTLDTKAEDITAEDVHNVIKQLKSLESGVQNTELKDELTQGIKVLETEVI